MSWIGLRCVIVVFPDHTHLRFHNTNPVIKVKEETFYSQVKSPIGFNFGRQKSLLYVNNGPFYNE